MSRTILDPQYANDLNGLFNGTGEIDTGSINSATTITASGNITSGGTIVAVNLNASGVITTTGSISTDSSVSVNGIVLSGSNNTLEIGSGNSLLECGSILSTGGITATGTVSVGGILSTGGITATGTVSVGGIVLSGGNNTLEIGSGNSLLECGSILSTGTITGASFAGGIGMTTVRNAQPGTISPSGSYTFPNIEIPNFIGYSATTAYVVSSNITTFPPLPFIYSVSYAGVTATSTLVDVLVMNVGTLSYNAAINFSIIAMN